MSSVLVFLALVGVTFSRIVKYYPNKNNVGDLTNTSNKIVYYWGQDSAGTANPNNLEKNLAYYCSLDTNNYDVLIMSFMISFIDTRQANCGVPNAPDLNFANHGNDCTTFPNCPFLLDCATTIGEDIKTCQSMGKTILLSLGGAVGSYGFTSDSQATEFATTMWDMFFEGSNSAGIRPFGDAIIDGIDLDIEGGSSVGYGSFVDALRNYMNESSKDYYITSAPQCVYPDAYMGPGTGKALTQSGRDFSWLNVQFYNNYCGVYQPSYFYPALSSWNDAALSAGYQILVGVPSAPNAGGGYISANQLCGMLSQIRTYKSFGGIMVFLKILIYDMYFKHLHTYIRDIAFLKIPLHQKKKGWDTSWDMNNNNFEFSTALRKCLGSV